MFFIQHDDCHLIPQFDRTQIVIYPSYNLSMLILRVKNIKGGRKFPKTNRRIQYLKKIRDNLHDDQHLQRWPQKKNAEDF